MVFYTIEYVPDLPEILECWWPYRENNEFYASVKWCEECLGYSVDYSRATHISEKYKTRIWFATSEDKMKYVLVWGEHFEFVD